MRRTGRASACRPPRRGCCLAPGSLLSLPLAPLVGRVGERHGSKPPFLAGCLLTAAALLGLGLAHDSVGLVILWCCVMFAGVGAAFAAIPNLIVSTVDEHETGEATGSNTVKRNIGSAVGAQVAGSIIAAHVLATGAQGDTGFTIAFLVGAGSAIVAAVSVLFILSRADQETAGVRPAAAATA